MEKIASTVLSKTRRYHIVTEFAETTKTTIESWLISELEDPNKVPEPRTFTWEFMDNLTEKSSSIATDHHRALIAECLGIYA